MSKMWKYKTERFSTEHFNVRCTYTGEPTEEYRTEHMVIDIKNTDPDFPFSVNISLFFPGMLGKPRAFLLTQPGYIFYPEEIDKFCETLKKIPGELLEIKEEAEKRFPGIEVVL